MTSLYVEEGPALHLTDSSGLMLSDSLPLLTPLFSRQGRSSIEEEIGSERSGTLPAELQLRRAQLDVAKRSKMDLEAASWCIALFSISFEKVFCFDTTHRWKNWNLRPASRVDSNLLYV